MEWAAPAVPAASGLILISTASFTSASAVSLPTGTFTSTYRNYRLFVNLTASSGGYFQMRLRSSGSDNTSSTYKSNSGYFFYQFPATVQADDAANNVNIWSRLGFMDSDEFSGYVDILQPQESKITSLSGRFTRAAYGAYIPSAAFNATTSFDSLTMIPASGTITGTYSVYGYAK